MGTVRLKIKLFKLKMGTFRLKIKLFKLNIGIFQAQDQAFLSSKSSFSRSK